MYTFLSTKITSLPTFSSKGGKSDSKSELRNFRRMAAQYVCTGPSILDF